MAKPKVGIRRSGDGWAVTVGGVFWEWEATKADAQMTANSTKIEIQNGDLTMRDVHRVRGRHRRNPVGYRKKSKKRKNPMGKNTWLWLLLGAGVIYILYKSKKADGPLVMTPGTAPPPASDANLPPVPDEGLPMDGFGRNPHNPPVLGTNHYYQGVGFWPPRGRYA